MPRHVVSAQDEPISDLFYQIVKVMKDLMKRFLLPEAALAASRLVRRLAPWLLVAGFAPAFAQTLVVTAPAAANKSAVTVELTQAKVVKGADGKEQLLDAATVKPGDIVEYKATYTNRSGKPINGLVANMPIPEGLEYIPKSAKPGSTLVKAATRDGVYAAEPLTVKVGTKTEPVPYAEYRMLRWSLDQLPAKGEVAVSARATVQTYVAPAAGIPAAAASLAQAPPVSVVRVPAKP